MLNASCAAAPKLNVHSQIRSLAAPLLLSESFSCREYAVTESRPSTRLSFLDGLRGVAVSLVVVYHAYVRWTAIVPFGREFEGFPLFAYGWLGVHLFFLISGFVILLTLEECANFQQFMLRRWLRLFPAMAICSALVFVSAPLFPERPAGMPHGLDLIPGLTFIEAGFWEKLLGVNVGVIDGAFWSLFVEAKFYLVFGGLFFLVGERFAIVLLFSSFVMATVLKAMMKINIDLGFPFLSWFFVDLISADSYGWFAAGALYYRYFHQGQKRDLVFAILAAIAAAVATHGFDLPAKLAALTIVATFTLAVLNVRAQSILGCSALVFMGTISYPLYLIHQNLLVALIVKIGSAAPWLPHIVVPIAPIAGLILLGWVIAAFLEPWARNALRPSYNRFCRIVGAA